MKLLVSDYDNTLHTSLVSLELNINAVKRFRKKGNLFAIATQRPYNSIKKEIKNYSIPLDYLICFGGNLVLDKQDNILHSNCITEKDLQLLSVITTNADDKTNYYLSNPQQIIELVSKFDSYAEAKDAKKVISKLVPTISSVQRFSTLYIKNRYTKSDGINKVLTITNIDPQNVYTVGDDINDIDMLQNYNGYKMLNSNPLLYFSGIPKTCIQVHQLIKRINN